MLLENVVFLVVQYMDLSSNLIIDIPWFFT